MLERDGGEVARATSIVRYEPGARPAPSARDGCTMFVKLRQLDPKETRRVVVDTRSAARSQGLVPGLEVLSLPGCGIEHTALVRWPPGIVFQLHRHAGGEAILVLEGVFSDEYGDYPAGTWFRSPHLSQHQPFSRDGCQAACCRGDWRDHIGQFAGNWQRGSSRLAVIWCVGTSRRPIRRQETVLARLHTRWLRGRSLTDGTANHIGGTRQQRRHARGRRRRPRLPTWF